ncbi:hypothetical protein ABKV19_019516 [Rosa sericea]
MKTLILAGCNKITDSGVSLLHKMSVLEELNLEECSVRITDVGGVAISAIPTLKKVQMGSLYSVTDNTIVALAQNCLNLELLELRGCKVTGAGIRAFSGHKCLQILNLFCCVSGIRGSDLERLARKCPALKSIVVDERLRNRMWRVMRDGTISKFLEFI